MSAFKTKDNIFIIETKNYQYVMGVGSDKKLHHLHWGKKIDGNDFDVNVMNDANAYHSSKDLATFEYTEFGSTVYRDCAIKAEFCDGTRDINLEYVTYDVKENTVTIFLKDSYYDFTVSLIYTSYPEFDIISRHTVIYYNGKGEVKIDRAYSAEFSLPNRNEYIIYNANGTWSGEHLSINQLLKGGTLQFESRKGITAHDNTPNFIAMPKNKNDEVYFATFAYSGNFKISANRDGFGKTRVMVGLNDFDFSYTLKSGCQLTLPKVYFGYAKAIDEMSNNVNQFAINNIFPENFRNKTLPVLYNSWEATEFDIDVESQKQLAEKASKMGVEIFVVDDGWFGERNNDKAGLGDWFVNKEKFPNGLSELSDYVNSLGMDFGLWIEPEMVNPDSNLYRNHPDWIFHFDTRKPSLLRNQLVLNLTKDEVQKYVFESIDKILTENNIKYVKWDMNRPFSEVGAENLENQQELWLRYTQAFYKIIDMLKEKHNQTQFEACASGGGRCDFGAYEHFDQVWTSDNTNPIDRIHIQNGYALLNPTKTMRAWVTDSGNAPLNFKFNISMQGSLGVGLNLFNCSEDDMNICANNISLYKKYNSTIQFGNRHLLMNLKDDELNAVQFVKDDKSIVFIATPHINCMHRYFKIRLTDLQADARYLIQIGDKKFEKSGSYLMNYGVERELSGEYPNEIWEITKLK